MEARSKARVVQEPLGMAFIEEVNEPGFRPSPEVTFHSVAAEEAPEPSPKPTLRPKTPNKQTKELVSAIKRLGRMKADGGKLREPEPFSDKDPKKLKAFIFNVNYISEALPISMMILRRLPLHCLIYGMLLRNGLNPEFLDLLMSLQYG